MDIDRREGESELDYHKRLVLGKLVDKTLADYDYTEISEKLYDKPYASDVARRMMYGSRRTLELLEKNELSNTADEAAQKIDCNRMELMKERQKLADQRIALNKLIRERARREELYEIINSVVSSGDLPKMPLHDEMIQIESDNDLIVSLNDMHYGAVVENYFRTYNSDVCAEMIADYADNIIRIANTHNSENCYIMCNGDVISGNIHYSVAVTNKENVIEQIMGASELIAWFIEKLSKHFNKVVFASVAGNHSRLNPNKEDTLYTERLDDIIGWYLRARLQDYSNVYINIEEKVDNTVYLIDVRGNTYCGVHGDYDDSPAKIQTLQTMAGRPLYAVMMGHMHHGKTDTVQGIKTIMAGSFLGMDDYCVQKRIYGYPEQTVCVCDESGIRCLYEVRL